MQVPVPACLRPSSAVAASAKQLRDSARSPWLAGSGICAFAVLPVAARGACLLVCPPVMCGNLRTLQCPSPHPGFPVAAETQGCRNPYVRPTRPSLTKCLHFSVHFLPPPASLWLTNAKYSESMPDVLGFDAPVSFGSFNWNPNSIKIIERAPKNLLWSLLEQADLWLQKDLWAYRASRPVRLVMITGFDHRMGENVCTFQ